MDNVFSVGLGEMLILAIYDPPRRRVWRGAEPC